MKTFNTMLLMMAVASVPMGMGCEDDTTTDSSAPADSAGTGGTSAQPMAGSDAQPTAGSDAKPMDGKDKPAADPDIVDTAVAAGDFGKLADALTKAGLVDALKGKGPFTVFAPTDAAFEAFENANPGVLAGLSKEELTGILTYHVVSGAAVKSTDLKDGQLVETLAGPVLAIDLDGGVKINDATVTKADIEASNGVIHVIDKIIMPPGDLIEVATAAGGFTTLASALTTAGLVDTLKGEGPFTVFAPTDDAFAAFEMANPGVIAGLSKEELGGVLTYHVLSGIAGPLDLVDGGAVATVAGSPVLFDLSKGAVIMAGEGTMATITTTNVVASNGVIHVIDAVILPPSKDIVQTAVDAGFTTLAGALTTQELVDDLQAPGPFTVFAPTDEAFAKLSAVPSGDALTNVLLYHVTEGLVSSGNLVDGEVKMLSGGSVTVDLTDGVKINDSKVTMANILAKNGIIHVVDAVLIP